MIENPHESEEKSRFAIYAECSPEIVSVSHEVSVDTTIEGPIDELSSKIPQLEVISSDGEIMYRSSMIGIEPNETNEMHFFAKFVIDNSFSPGIHNIVLSIPGESGAFAIPLHIVESSYQVDIKTLEDALTKRDESADAFDKKDFEKAKSLTKEVADLYEKLNLRQNAAEALSDVSSVYLNQQKYKDAEIFAAKALKLNQEVRDKRATAICYFRLGKIQEALGNIDAAIKHYNAAADLHEKLNISNLALRDYSSLYDLSIKSNKFNEARRFYVKALDLAIGLIESPDRSDALHFLADTKPPKQILESIDRFHTFISKITVPKVDIDSVIEDSIVDFGMDRKALEKVITVNFERSREQIKTSIDRNRLKVLISNFLEKAASLSAEEESMTIQTERLGDEFSIRLTHIELPEEVRSKIFEPSAKFQTGKKKLVEPRLGLTVIRNIVEAHGGTVSVKPEKGEITEIFFTLPIKSRI